MADVATKAEEKVEKGELMVQCVEKDWSEVKTKVLRFRKKHESKVERSVQLAKEYYERQKCKLVDHIGVLTRSNPGLKILD